VEDSAVMRVDWPSILWVARHGQSAGNVARDAAEAAGHALIDIEYRDIDTPLSALGIEQSRALGRWFARRPPDERPQVVLCSPYVRARETARLVWEEAGWKIGEELRLRVDERLREKEFGILDRLTKFGIQSKYPELHAQRSHVGKFYFRPPGGESWCDVILRLRSLTEMITREHAGERVLVVAHQVIVNCMRYLLENLDEASILAIDAEADVPNCGVTSYRKDPASGDLRADLVNFLAPLEEAGAPVTVEPDAPAAPKP
jgi:broad specificity phosphatase PhoE